MNKMGKKIMALLVVFTSIISLLPAEFSGQIAKAATESGDATTVQAYLSGNSTPLPVRTESNETIYTSSEFTSAGFDITVKDETTTTAKLIDEVNRTSQSATGVVAQKVDIISINKTPITDTATLNTFGIKIEEFNNIPNTPERIGKKITGLPLGINKIEYKITISTQMVNYVKPIKDTNGNDVAQSPKVNDVETKQYANQNLTIENATNYVTNKIVPMIFDAYIGAKSELDTKKENNTIPFKYSTEAKPDKNMALRYTFDVPDSISTLEYSMTFTSELNLNNAEVYRNGTKDTSFNITDQTLTGNLAKPGEPDLIVIKLDPNQGTNKSIQKSYAIEIKYTSLNAINDYSLKSAGIAKLDYENDSNVVAFIGKRFKINHDNNFPEYIGEITIDKKAGMICLDPSLVRTKDTVAYVVTNNYVDNTGIVRVKKSILKNGKQFIDFMASSTHNVLQVDVYEGKDGNITGSSPLARYSLTVNLQTGNDFTMGLKFTNSSGSTYLTQPGVKENIIDKFTKDRRTYDLYTPDPVTVTLTGARSTKNEYIRVWLGDEVESNNLKETTASSNNAFEYSDPAAQNYLERGTSLDITFGKSKKIIVQAYYDEFEYDLTGKIKTNSDGVPIYNSYSIGDKYVFYLPNNFGGTDTPSTGDKSDNATLSLLTTADGTLKSIDGDSGFLSDKLDYTVTVPKENTSAKITATAQDDNVKSIVATIDGQEGAYDLISGQASELPLNTNGKTNIEIVVTAQNGTTSKTYTVLVTNNPKGSNVNLKNIILNVGDYTFDPKNDVTKVRVDQKVSSIKVTPVPEDTKSKVTVNGEEFLDSPIKVSLKGTQKTEINIEVSSEDGTDSKTYTLDVYRVDVSDWDNDSDNDNDNDSNEDDQFYDEYNECWVDLTKYDEWGSVNGKPTYFDKKSRQVKEAWISTGGKYYYLNNLGYRASGWKVDKANGKTYYLDPTTGEMKKGWMNLNNSWYYLGLNGVMQKGWLYLNNKWYYFTPNGQMVTNQSMFVDDKVYNFAQDGAVY